MYGAYGEDIHRVWREGGGVFCPTAKAAGRAGRHQRHPPSSSLPPRCFAGPCRLPSRTSASPLPLHLGWARWSWRSETRSCLSIDFSSVDGTNFLRGSLAFTPGASTGKKQSKSSLFLSLLIPRAQKSSFVRPLTKLDLCTSRRRSSNCSSLPLLQPQHRSSAPRPQSCPSARTSSRASRPTWL